MAMSACGSLLSPWVAPSSCYQPTFTTDGSAQLATDGDCFPSACYGAYYSPAVCPSGWNTYTTWTTNWPSPSPKPHETAYGCCPGSLTGQNALMGCAGHIFATAGMTINAQGEKRTTTFSPSAVSVSAYDLKIRNVDGDSSRLTLVTAVPTASKTASMANKRPKAKGGRKHLSTAARVSIGLIALVIIVIIATVIFFIFRRRGARKRHANNGTGIEIGDNTSQRRFEVEGHHVECPVAEVSGTIYHEADSPWGPKTELPGHHPYPAEIDSRETPFELDAKPAQIIASRRVEEIPSASSTTPSAGSTDADFRFRELASEVSSPSDVTRQSPQTPASPPLAFIKA